MMTTENNTTKNNAVTHEEFQEAMATVKADFAKLTADIAELRKEFKSEVKWIGGVVFALNLVVFSGLIHIALTG